MDKDPHKRAGDALAGQIIPKPVQDPNYEKQPTTKDLSNINLLTGKEFAKSGIMYVVMDKDCTTVLQWPGINQPFNTKRRRYAEQVARESGGIVKTLRDAIRLVATSPCNLPPTHKWYNADKTAAKMRTIPND